MSLLKDKIELEIDEAELGIQKSLIGFPPFFRGLIIIFAIAIIPVYYISRSVSEKIAYSKYEQNAIVAKPSFTNPTAPQISNVSVTSEGSGQYAAVVQISNPNLDLSLDQVPYQFIFYNAQKQQIYNYSDNLYLLPNETKFLTVPTFTSPQPISYTNFQLPPTLPWQKRLSIPTVTLTTSLPSYSQQSSPPAFVVSGDFYNDSPYVLGQATLTFVLYDAGGNIIGTSARAEFTVEPFERRTYKQLWPNLIAPNLSQVQVTADTDTLDPNNLSVPSFGSNSASSLSRPTPTGN